MADFILRTDYGNEINTYTHGQSEILNAADHNDVVIVLGPAGTGKTFVSVALALESVRQNKVDTLTLTRPAVQAGEDLGFLPGELDEKLEPYMSPFHDSLRKVLNKANYHNMHEKGQIVYEPLGFLRGRTISGTVVLDEAQNATQAQMEMLLTRLGKDGSAFITGDPSQTDLPGHVNSALDDVESILGCIRGIKVVQLTEEDIVRHRIVRDVIVAYRNHNKQKRSPKPETYAESSNQIRQESESYREKVDEFADFLERRDRGLSEATKYYTNGH